MDKTLKMMSVTSQPPNDQDKAVSAVPTDVPKMANSGASSRLIINCSVGSRNILKLEFIIKVVLVDLTGFVTIFAIK